MSIWTSVDVFSQRASGPQTLPMCSLYHIAAMGSHGDAQKAPWVAYGHAQSDSDDRLTANPGRLAVEPLQQFLQQKGCCRGLYSTHTVSHGLISSTTSLQHLYNSLQQSTVYSSTAVLQSTTSTPPLRLRQSRTVGSEISTSISEIGYRCDGWKCSSLIHN